MSKIHFTIAPGGGVKIDAVGFTGNACAAATAPFESILQNGGDNTREIKPEWHMTSTEGDQEQHASI